MSLFYGSKQDGSVYQFSGYVYVFYISLSDIAIPYSKIQFAQGHTAVVDPQKSSIYSSQQDVSLDRKYQTLIITHFHKQIVLESSH